MKWLGIALPVVLLSVALPCSAENTKSDSRSSIAISPGELAPTQDMWFYEQNQKKQMDPKAAVREQAAFRTAERHRRIATLRWYGFSNQRPTAESDPVHGDYGARWTSGDVNVPNNWSGPANSVLVVRPSASPTRGY